MANASAYEHLLSGLAGELDEDHRASKSSQRDRQWYACRTES